MFVFIARVRQIVIFHDCVPRDKLFASSLVNPNFKEQSQEERHLKIFVGISMRSHDLYSVYENHFGREIIK